MRNMGNVGLREIPTGLGRHAVSDRPDQGGQCRSDRHLDLAHVGHPTLLENTRRHRAALERYPLVLQRALDIADRWGSWIR